MASQALRVLGGPSCLSPTSTPSLPAWARAAVGPRALPIAQAGLAAPEQPLSTPRDGLYGERFQLAAGALGCNHFLMGASSPALARAAGASPGGDRGSFLARGRIGGSGWAPCPNWASFHHEVQQDPLGLILAPQIPGGGDGASGWLWGRACLLVFPTALGDQVPQDISELPLEGAELQPAPRWLLTAHLNRHLPWERRAAGATQPLERG